MSPPSDAQSPSERASAALDNAFRKGRELASGLVRGEGLVELLTIVVLVGGSLLIVADFLDLFRIEAGTLPVQDQSGGDQHSFAMLVVGAAVIGATLVARSTRQWPPAAAVAILALIAIVIALVGDLPAATRSDLVRGARIAKAEPAIGFWIELTGAGLAVVGGVGLALLLRRTASR